MRASSVIQAILDVLEEKNTHLTSREIYDCIHDRLPAVNPSTVYRALERLAQQGLISVSDMGTGAMVFEQVTSHNHHHLVCQQCGRILNIEDREIQNLFTNIEMTSGYRMTTNHLVLFGICPDCRQENPE
jgi:Fur family ferric uptake transcriptional regulator